MTKKTFALITGITGGIGTIAAAVVTFIQPAYMTAIVAAIGVGVTAVNEICGLFVVEK